MKGSWYIHVHPMDVGGAKTAQFVSHNQIFGRAALLGAPHEIHCH